MLRAIAWIVRYAASGCGAPPPFEVDLTEAPDPLSAEPWKGIRFPEAWAGRYVVAGDVDGDGRLALVTGRNAEQVMATEIIIEDRDERIRAYDTHWTLLRTIGAPRPLRRGSRSRSSPRDPRRTSPSTEAQGGDP